MPKNKAYFSPNIWLCVLLASVTLIVYWQIGHNDFIDFDDNLYITDNYHVKNGISVNSLSWAFKYNGIGYWQPLTWLSHMLDCHFFGLNPGAHHLINLLFHVANSLLLFFLFKRATGQTGRSAVIAFLFALHPLSVESVAWAAERKNILSTFFWMCAMYSYLGYAIEERRLKYCLAILFYALGLMTKPMLVTLPFVFLLVDFWPLKRLRFKLKDRDLLPSMNQQANDKVRAKSIGQLIVEKIPFFVLSLVAVLVSVNSLQHYGDIHSTEQVALNLRLSNALVSYVGYIVKMVWPVDLTVFYPFPDSIPWWKAAFSGLIIIFVSALVLSKIKAKPYLCVGWFWYAGTLFPVIGIVQTGLWPAMADRWMYIPGIGLFIIVVWVFADLLGRLQASRWLSVGAATLVLCFLAGLTWYQIRHWRNSIELFEHNVRTVGSNFIAHNSMGSALIQAGKYDEAMTHLKEALRLNSNDANTHYNMGLAYSKLGDVSKAIHAYKRALQINPTQAKAHNNLGALFLNENNLDSAKSHFFESLRFQPKNAETHNNLGVLLKKQGSLEKAAMHYLEAIRLDPNLVQAYNNLGLVCMTGGKYVKAAEYFQQALNIRPDFESARINLQIARKHQSKK